MVKDGIWDVFIGEFALSGGYQLDISKCWACFSQLLCRLWAIHWNEMRIESQPLKRNLKLAVASPHATCHWSSRNCNVFTMLRGMGYRPLKPQKSPFFAFFHCFWITCRHLAGEPMKLHSGYFFHCKIYHLLSPFVTRRCSYFKGEIHCGIGVQNAESKLCMRICSEWTFLGHWQCKVTQQ